MKHRVEPTTETIEGKVYERMHYLDAVEKYPESFMIFVNDERVGDYDIEPDDFVMTIVGVYTDNDEFVKSKWEWKDKGYDVGAVRTTDWGVVV